MFLSFFPFCAIAGYTVELNPEGKWMEKSGVNGLMSEHILNKADLEVSYYITYYFFKLFCLPWIGGATEVWISEKFESKWGLEIKKKYSWENRN